MLTNHLGFCWKQSETFLWSLLTKNEMTEKHLRERKRDDLVWNVPFGNIDPVGRTPSPPPPTPLELVSCFRKLNISQCIRCAFAQFNSKIENIRSSAFKDLSIARRKNKTRSTQRTKTNTACTMLSKQYGGGACWDVCSCCIVRREKSTGGVLIGKSRPGPGSN